MKESFCFAYKALLESIRDKDDLKLGQLCEKNLYRDFYDTSFDLNREVKTYELLNDDEFWMERTRIEVVDYM